MRKIKTFWNWFQDNNQSIKNIHNETQKNQKHLFFWLNKHLHYYCKEIDFVIAFPKKPMDKATLIITANGNPEYFKQVEDLIDNAPRLRTWIFTAFIKPKEDLERIMDGLDNPFIFKDITIKASDIMFLPLNCDEAAKKLTLGSISKITTSIAIPKTGKKLYVLSCRTFLVRSMYTNTSILFNWHNYLIIKII